MCTRPAILLAALIAGTAALHAQAPPAPATPMAETAPPKPMASTDCAPTKAVPPHGTVAPEGQTTGQASEPLGDRLAKSNGVLCPPTDVDPAMRAPAPDTGNTPVIPPPGSPGGNPNVQPK
jgi:hypothetical protein